MSCWTNPPIKEGLRMKLYQLTGQARVLGYIKTTLFVQDMERHYASFNLEAYMVKGMCIPLLLGEDFQSTYELGVKQSVSGHSEIRVGQSNCTFPASSVQQINLGFEIRQAYISQSFIRQKAIA